MSGDVDLVEVHGAARAADDLRPAGIRDPGPDLVVHLNLVAVREDDDAPAALVDIRTDELGEDREYLLIPAEDDRVLGLDDPRATLPELRETALDARVDDADEGADHEQPAEGDEEHRAEEACRAGVAAHRSRVQRPQQAHPDQLGEGPALGVRPEGEDRDRDQDDDQRRDGKEADDQGDRAPREELVDGIAETIAPGRFHGRSVTG